MLETTTPAALLRHIDPEENHSNELKEGLWHLMANFKVGFDLGQLQSMERRIWLQK
ncbi:MAG: hypothetical protein ACRCYY_10735 [Trueperaceae bacterium]